MLHPYLPPPATETGGPASGSLASSSAPTSSEQHQQLVQHVVSKHRRKVQAMEQIPLEFERPPKEGRSTSLIVQRLLGVDPSLPPPS